MYGCQTPGLEGEQEPFRTIEQIAAFDVKRILEIQPEGPLPSTWPLSRSCRFRLRFGPFLVPKNRIWSRDAGAAPVLRGRRLESGGLLCLGAAGIEPATTQTAPSAGASVRT
jgi:hypothetical protein